MSKHPHQYDYSGDCLVVGCRYNITAELSDLRSRLEAAERENEHCRECHGVRCGDCGAIETIVRPGKYQCDSCSYWACAIDEDLGVKHWDESGYHDPRELMRSVRAQLANMRSVISEVRDEMRANDGERGWKYIDEWADKLSALLTDTKEK